MKEETEKKEKMCPGETAKKALGLIEKTAVDSESCIIECELKGEDAYHEAAQALSRILGVIQLANALSEKSDEG